MSLFDALLGNTRHAEPPWSIEERQAAQSEAAAEERRAPYETPRIGYDPACTDGCSSGHMSRRQIDARLAERERMINRELREQREQGRIERFFRPGRVSVEIIDGKFVEVER